MPIFSFRHLPSPLRLNAQEMVGGYWYYSELDLAAGAKWVDERAGKQSHFQPLCSPGAKAPPALDVSKVVLDRDAVEAGAKVLVEARHPQLGGHQLLRGNGPEAASTAIC